MANKELTAEQKRLGMDLWIIVAVTFAVLGVFIVFQSPFAAFARSSEHHILLRVLLSAAFQFGVAGLGITIVALLRKESFLSYGLKAKGAILSILLCALCYVPSLAYSVVTGQFHSYLPFQMVWTTRDVLASGFPTNVIGYMLTATAWGFFEGFNYVVVSDKLNRRFASKYKWLDWGAILCAIFCIIIHGAIGVTADSIIEMITDIIIIYGMLMVKKFTGNAWGCVFIFVFLWNAF